MWIYSKHIFENVNQAKKYLKDNRRASENDHTEVVKILLADERVRNKLTKKEIGKYGKI